MLEFLDKFKEESIPIVRYSVGLVFFLFGISQLLNPVLWTAWVPQFIPFAPKTVVITNGIFDLIIGFFLILGLFLRFFSFIGILHLIGITASVGYNDIGIRDFGILLALVAVFLHGPDQYCIDSIWGKKKEVSNGMINSKNNLKFSNIQTKEM